MTSLTETKILDVAQELVQTRGYRAFSYRDLAQRIGIKTASIHYHFATKADLAQALVVRYRERIRAFFEGLDSQGLSPREKLVRYVEMFKETLSDDNRFCLCGMLAAEQASLPPVVREDVDGFFADHERWLAKVLEQGAQAGHFSFVGSAPLAARALLSALEGAQLTARTSHDRNRFDAAAGWLIDQLEARPAHG